MYVVESKRPIIETTTVRILRYSVWYHPRDVSRVAIMMRPYLTFLAESQQPVSHTSQTRLDRGVKKAKFMSDPPKTQKRERTSGPTPEDHMMSNH
eukprot:scaffold12404_cov137-Amphora_coffeaeformis.AAC.1